MRHFSAILAALLLGAGAAQAADPAEGLWKTEPGDSGGYLHVSVYGCGAALCGVIREAFDKSGTAQPGYDHLDKRMLWDMQAKGGGSYDGGKIWAPDRGKTYNSRMQLSGNKLTVKGCVFGICRGQTWTRVQ